MGLIREPYILGYALKVMDDVCLKGRDRGVAGLCPGGAQPRSVT